MATTRKASTVWNGVVLHQMKDHIIQGPLDPIVRAREKHFIKNTLMSC